MKVSNEESRVESYRSLIRGLTKRALEEAQINETTVFTYLGGNSTSWRENNGDIELVLTSRSMFFLSGFNVSVGLGHFAERVLAFKQSYDGGDVQRLSTVIKYIVDVITSIPTTVQSDLMAGSINSAIALFESGSKGEVLDRLKQVQSNFPKLEKSTVGRTHRKALRAEPVRGGNRRTKRDWLNEDNLKRYAEKVNDRITLAGRIKSVFQDCLEDDSWMEDMKRDRTILLLSQDLPSDTLVWAARRVADEGVASDEREPQAIACEIACRELGYEHPGSTKTLQDYYRKGATLLEADRRSLNR